MKTIQTKLISLSIFVLLIVLVSFGVKRWQKTIVIRQNELAKNAVLQLIEEADFSGAWSLLEGRGMAKDDPEWGNLRLDTLVGLRDVEELELMFEETPDYIVNNEKASALLARKFAHQRETDSFLNLHSQWVNKAHDTNLWTSLDIDHDLLSGNAEVAWSKLNSIKISGELSSNQLIQRALIQGRTNTFAALNDLNLAVSADPFSPETRSFRGQIFESLGDVELARVEYVSAHLSDPNNPLWRDQLAEFYRRYQKYDFALNTWMDAEPSLLTDYIWLKIAFWRRVIGGENVQAHEQIPKGPLSQLATSISDLPQDQFWNKLASKNINNITFLEGDRQEIYWLMILQMLKEGDEQKASDLLKNPPFKSGVWDVYLHEALSSVIRFRQTGRFSSHELLASNRSKKTESQHLLIKKISDFRKAESSNSADVVLSPELEALLKGPSAYSAVFMASGWREAALILFSDPSDLAHNNYPSWFNYGIGQLMRYNRSSERALEYLENQNQTNDIKVLIGELNIGLGETKKAMTIFRSLASVKSPEGARSAWFVTIDLLENELFKEAVGFIKSNPNLGDSVQGIELQAKTAELDQDLKTATELYQSISGQSAIAKRFLADVAFKNGDFQNARQLTLDLLVEFPDDMQTMSNLRAIDSEIELVR